MSNKVLINKLQNTLNELINRNDLSVKTTELSNELLETTKIIENCTSCKDEKIDGNELDKCLAKLEKEEQGWEKEDIIGRLFNELNKIDFELNKKILCESCKGKKISHYDDYYIRWIPFNEFKNIEYLAKGSFGEVHKATWINGYYDKYKKKYYDQEVVLKKIYNNSSDDKIVDILKEVK